MNELFPAFNVNYSGKGWQSLLVMYDKRNSLMHPNKPYSLDVTKQEVQVFEEGKFWFNALNMDLLHLIKYKVEEELSNRNY